MSGAQTRITLWGVEVFIAIAEEGSISTAARRIGASASAASQQLTNLENALGVLLVDRTARPLRLTPAGTTFRTRAQTILNETLLAQAELASRDLRSLTRLRLGMIEDFDADVTPRLLSDMAGDLAGCRFLLETGASHRLFELLRARDLDVIVAADTGEAEDWMEVHRLVEDPFVAVVPPALAQGVQPNRERLRGLPFIQYTQRHHMGRVIAAHLARENEHPAHRFELDSYHAIMAMVAEGAGWTIATPLGVFRAGRFVDRVAVVPLPLAPLSRSIALIARRDVLGDMPRQMSLRLLPIIDRLIAQPAIARYPWLAPHLRNHAPVTGGSRPAHGRSP